MTPKKVYTKEGVNDLLKDISAVYELQDNDITIVGPGVIIAEAYEVILSQDLIDVIVEGKKPIFVNATLMNVLTDGQITTQMLFNNITTNLYNSLLSVDNLYTYANISGLMGISVLDILIFKTNDKYYIAPHQYGLDLDMYLTQNDLSILDLGNNQIEINYLGSIYTAGGGKQLYQHRILLAQSSNTYNHYNIFFDIVSTRPTAYTKADLWTYLSTTLLNANISATGYHGNTLYPNPEHMVYSIIHNGTNLQVKRFKINSSFIFELTNANISSTSYNNSSTTLTDTVIEL